MPKKKLIRFAAIKKFPNVFDDPYHFKAKWRQDYFRNKSGITLELGCGKGDYTVFLAFKFPHRNFIGIDIKGNRLWAGAKAALDNNLKNVAFLRIPIERIDQVFDENEIKEIWIPFPDPYPKRSNANRRLISPGFLQKYKHMLMPGGTIHLKTDDQALFEYSLKIIPQNGGTVLTVTDDLHNSDITDEIIRLRTIYEKQHLRNGKKIMYISFCL